MIRYGVREPHHESSLELSRTVFVAREREKHLPGGASLDEHQR